METALLLLSSGSVSWLHGFRVRFLFQHSVCPPASQQTQLAAGSFQQWAAAQVKVRARSWDLPTAERCSLVAAHSGILHTTPTPAAVEAWNQTHYTYTCRGPEAARGAGEFYTQHFRPSRSHVSAEVVGKKPRKQNSGLQFCCMMKPLQLFYF